MIPPLIENSLHHYADSGRPTGGFLRAVLSNDLQGALGKADSHSAAALAEIVQYCEDILPAESWGSPEKVTGWLHRHRK